VSDSLLRSMLQDAFADDEPMEKEAETQSVDRDTMLKLADGLEHIAYALGDGGDSILPVYGTENEAGGVDPIDEMESPERWVAPGETTSALTAAQLGQAAFSPPGWQGSVPSGIGNQGLSFGDNMGGDRALSNEGGIIHHASLRKQARLRASGAMSKVLGRLKAASMRRTAAEDPAMTGNLPEDLSSAGEPPTQPPAPAAADVPQDPETYVEFTNRDSEDVNQPEERAILGSTADGAAEASDVAGEIYDHESGDEEPTIKAAQAAILRRAVLANIGRGG
jgi:hypothetical protein